MGSQPPQGDVALKAVVIECVACAVQLIHKSQVRASLARECLHGAVGPSMHSRVGG